MDKSDIPTISQPALKPHAACWSGIIVHNPNPLPTSVRRISNTEKDKIIRIWSPIDFFPIPSIQRQQKWGEGGEKKRGKVFIFAEKQNKHREQNSDLKGSLKKIKINKKR